MENQRTKKTSKTEEILDSVQWNAKRAQTHSQKV